MEKTVELLGSTSCKCGKEYDSFDLSKASLKSLTKMGYAKSFYGGVVKRGVSIQCECGAELDLLLKNRGGQYVVRNINYKSKPEKVKAVGTPAVIDPPMVSLTKMEEVIIGEPVSLLDSMSFAELKIIAKGKDISIYRMSADKLRTAIKATE